MKIATLSFDDGDVTARAALKVLAAEGVSATFYLPLSQFFGSGLTADEYAGHEIGAHTKTHRSLLALTYEEVRDEIEGCLPLLRCNTERPVRCFAYPYGLVPMNVEQVFEDCGIAWARTVETDATQTVQDRFRMGITCLLDRGTVAPVAEATAGAGRPVHIVGHAWHLAKGDNMGLLERAIALLKRHDYEIVPNAEYWDRLSHEGEAQ